jgi:Protein of unknown function (DUF3606)
MGNAHTNGRLSGQQKEDALMPDDKTKVGKPDRSRVSGDQDYEVQQFAEKHGITPRALGSTDVLLAPITQPVMSKGEAP